MAEETKTSEQLIISEKLEFHDLIIERGLLDLSLCEFFAETHFNADQYFSSDFWFRLNTIGDDEWFPVTDDIIRATGFKGVDSKVNYRTNFFTFLKKNFSVDRHYKTTSANVVAPQNGGRNKLLLFMKRDPFKRLLMKINTAASELIYNFYITFERQVLKYMVYQKEAAHQKAVEADQKALAAQQEVLQLQARLAAERLVPPLNIIQRNILQNTSEKLAIYVMTSRQYAQQYLYKIGRARDVRSRVQTMNTTHVFAEDEMYVCHKVFSYDSQSCEKHLHNILAPLRYKQNREFFACDFQDLREIVDMVADSFNVHNERIDELVRHLNGRVFEEINLVIPKPIYDEMNNVTNNALVCYDTRNGTKRGRSNNDILLASTCVINEDAVIDQAITLSRSSTRVYWADIQSAIRKILTEIGVRYVNVRWKSLVQARGVPGIVWARQCTTLPPPTTPIVVPTGSIERYLVYGKR